MTNIKRLLELLLYSSDIREWPNTPYNSVEGLQSVEWCYHVILSEVTDICSV